MNFEDTEQFMKDLASFHAACWGEPVSDQPGLGPFKAHWQSLNDEYWSEDGTTTWDDVLPKWEEIYEEPIISTHKPAAMKVTPIKIMRRSILSDK